MRQSRLECYFPSLHQKERPEDTGKTWLDLPLHLRKRIYVLLGLIPPEDGSWGRISMNRNLTQMPRCMLDSGYPESQRCRRCNWLIRNPLCFPNEGNYCECSPLPLHLAAVCRAAEKDVKEIFYSELYLCVIHSADGKLSALENLSPLALASLRNLMIRATIPLMGEGDYFIEPPCHPICSPVDYNQPLGYRHISRNDRILLSDLRRVLKRLALHIQPGLLNLTFVCDSQSNEIDEQILGILLELPRLRSCSISLSKDHRPHTERMIREACLKLVGYSNSYINDPFPFRRLPHELQIQVLEKTYLVSPYHLYYEPLTNQPLRLRWRQPNSPSDHCFYGWNCLQNEENGCCHCNHRGSAYSTSCCCYDLPSTLFLVDRQMEQDARRVMYMNNTWLMRHTWAKNISHNSSRAIYNLTDFLKHTRNLSLVCLEHLPEAGRPFTEWSPWYELLRNITMIKPQNLTLTIMLPHPRTKHGPLPMDIRAAIWTRQLLVIQAIKELLTYGKRFKDFFVSIRGYHWGDDQQHGWFKYLCPETDGNMEPWELILERMVMGEGYESCSRGKVGSIHQYVPGWDGKSICGICAHVNE